MIAHTKLDAGCAELVPSLRRYLACLAASLCVMVALLCASPSIGAAAVPFQIAGVDGGLFAPNGDPFTQAGAHPDHGSVTFDLSTVIDGAGVRKPTGTLRGTVTDLPLGLIGNPKAVPACPAELTPLDECPDDSQIGYLVLRGNNLGANARQYFALYNGEPPKGTAALFRAKFAGAPVLIEAKLRPDDYGVSALTINAPQTVSVFGVQAVIWGVPADPSHDSSRGVRGGWSCLDASVQVHCPPSTPSSAPRLPFLTLPTSCVGPVDTDITVSTWEGASDSASFTSHDNATPTPNPIGNDGCADVPFSPTVSISPTSTAPDSASGVDADIAVPSNGLLNPNGISQAHLKKAVVELPAGVSVNPSGATGLGSCSDAQLDLGTDSEPTCPDSSTIGAVEVTTPLIDEHLTGEVVLRPPTSTDPTSGDMLRMAIVARSEERGILVKLPGTATADPVTGQLKATFDNNPQVPFSNLEVSIKGGNRGLVAMPQGCGEIQTTSTLSPWSASLPVTSLTPLTVTGECANGFAPKLAAGMSTQTARGSGDFSFKFSREDGEQWIDGLTAQLPKGLLASVKGVPLCSSGDAQAGSCPAGSRIGTVDATAGSGTPFVLERKGDAYLTQGYKGCAYGLAVKVPVVAGPFDASSPETDLGNIVVRQAVCVDPTTAEISVVSDPLPTIWHGIPLRVRSVTVKVDRAGFMLNPSDCSAKTVGAKLHSAPGATADVGSPFQASGCANLPYKPKLALALTGRRQVTTGKHPGVKATVTQQGVGEAGIAKTVVRLPKTLALDPDNAQALCEFEDGTKPDLENRCPKGSIVGRARAASPLLNDPLVGNVYFVKNVRKDPTTGNLIRTLPMLIVALRGEIAVNLKGESSTTGNGRLVNTFDQIPDAPISQFNLNIAGGPNGILAVTRTRKAKINLCASRQTAEADTDGHNGRRHDLDVNIKTPCTKKQTKAAKLQAKRAAAKARG
jgi:hypothetical protein